MADSIDRSTSVAKLFLHLLAGLAVLVVVPPVACIGVHHLRHPAPLGRSAAAIRAHLDVALPPGTALERAQRFLTAKGIEASLYRDADAEQSYGRDADWARGPVLVALLPSVDLGLNEWDAIVTLYFTPDGRLAGRTAVLTAVNPL